MRLPPDWEFKFFCLWTIIVMTCALGIMIWIFIDIIRMPVHQYKPSCYYIPLYNEEDKIDTYIKFYH